MKKISLLSIVALASVTLAACSSGSTEKSTSNDSVTVSEEVKKDIPQEYKNVVKKAESYINTMHMSKQGVYDQLTSEFDKFTPEQAQYAIDNLEIDYNEVAVKKGEDYYKTMNMSKQGIYNQLTSEFDKFTAEEAQYAIDNLKLDYKESAYKKGKTYFKDMAMSLEAVKTQLIDFEHFTEEEAQYAVDKLAQE
ncbi:Ltp family lipoprotein [Streptococcus pluranimalium]|uniref:Ltp family lipoprotein n=1 Tax=Streptococcus pluranimalium TaxID=82348 RepID=UPI003F67B05C